MVSKLILMRHGKSKWNALNIFTGWVDVPLNIDGLEEAKEAGLELATTKIDVAFVSSLARAQQTLLNALAYNEVSFTPVIFHPDNKKLASWGKIHSEKTSKEILPVHVAWQLNERMYGELQGKNKEDVKKEVGNDVFKQWRRGYDTPPPEGESLKMTAQRCLPYFQEKVFPFLEKGKTVIISAHGNSLRSIIMHLDGLSKEQVVSLEIPTGKPIIYTYENGEFTRA